MMSDLDMLKRELEDLRNQLAKNKPQIRGFFTIESFREDGKLVQRSEGENILTLTGREFYSELAVLSAWSPRATFRDDRLAYFGLGIGAQPEIPNITSLVTPVAYTGTEFLAPVQAPATFPAGVVNSRTSVRLIREYSRAEINPLGATIVLTEAGIFSDGDPASNWAVGSRPTSLGSAATDAPFFYKTFEPLVKTPDTTIRLTWELRVV